MEHPSSLAGRPKRGYVRAMKVKDADILFVPDHGGAGPLHWQSRWQPRLSTARRAQPGNRFDPRAEAWVGSVAEAVNAATRPVILVGHSLGVAAITAAADTFRQPVAGAFLVAPPDPEGEDAPGWLAPFGAYPTDPLTFPSLLVASRNDPLCSFTVAEDLASAWGSLLIDAGQAGRIDAADGYGPWPEGSMAFAAFVSRL